MNDISYWFICALVFFLGYKVTDQWFVIRRLKRKADCWDAFCALMAGKEAVLFERKSKPKPPGDE